MAEPTNDNLYIDPDAMDFSSLVDENEFPEEFTSTMSDEPDVVDYEDDEDYYDDPNDGTEDLTGNLDEDDLKFNPHNGMAPDDYFLTLDDDAVLPFGSVTKTKAELNEIVGDHEYAKASADFYRTQDAFAFNQYNDYIASVLNESTSETERSIQWLQQSIADTRRNIQAAQNNGNWDAVATLKTTLADHTLSLQEYTDRKEVLDSRNNEIKQIRDVQAQQIFNAKKNETDNYMFRKFGQKWNMEGQAVYQWAIDKGIPYESIKGALCPALAEILMLHRDREIAQLSKKNQTFGTVQQKINHVATSRTPRKTTNRVNPTNQDVAKRNAQMRHKMNNGGLTQDEAISMFSGLVD